MASADSLYDGAEPFVSSRVIAGTPTRVIEMNGREPVLLLLHGFSDQADTWFPLMNELRAVGRRAVAVDLPGFGQSPPLAPGRVLPQYDAFVQEALRLYTVDGIPPVVVGNSLGAVLAVRAAGDPDTPVTGIVPISPAGYGHACWIRSLERVPRVMRLAGLQLLPMSAYRRLTMLAFPLMVTGSGHMVKGAAAAYSAQFRNRGDLGRLLGSAADVLTEVRDSALESAPAFPMLLIWGDRDRLTLSTGAERLLAMVADSEVAELAILPGCGHCPQLEKPAEIATLVDDFIGRLEAADRS